MKKRFLFLPFLAAMMFAGCSNDDPVVDPNNGGATGEPQFLTVNLVTTGEASSRSRAGGDQTTGDPDNNKTYEDGYDKENNVTSVRFYFFTSNGEPANVQGASKLNYLDYENPAAESDNKDPNIEKILSAKLILQSNKGDAMPSTMVAIINPTSDLPTNETTLEKLKTKVGNYASDGTTTSGKFVMSNSTYGKNAGENNLVETMEVSVKDNIKSDPDEALANAVKLYVERTVAKVRLGYSSEISAAITLDDGIKLLDPSKTVNNSTIDEMFGETKIYVKFLGWNATAVADKSRLIKKINTSWSGTILGSSFGPWNWEDYCRSFWALNAESVGYQYGAFNSTNDSENLFQAQAQTNFDDKETCVYLNENAEGSTTDTKVIIAAQLVDKDGNSVQFAQWGSGRYALTGDKNVKYEMVNACALYKKIVEGDKTIYKKVEPSDVELVTATIAGVASESVNGRYKVYLNLTEEAKKTDWYPSNNENQAADAKLSVAKANEALRSVGYAKVWTEGYTYYYFDIDHGSKKGVVRNHIYDAKIKSLVGLGTPVYDPDEIIYPEKPDDETDQYLAAEINILSWRVVSNDVDLKW